MHNSNFVENKYCFILIAGPNGAGKSTFVKNNRHLLDILRYFAIDYVHNPDKLASYYCEKYKESLDKSNKKALDDIELEVDGCISNYRSVAVETVLASEKYKKYWIDRNTENTKFEKILFYIGIESPLVSEKHIKMRVLNGGHDIPKDKIEPRFNTSINNLVWFAKRADIFYIYENKHIESSNDPGETYVLIANKMGIDNFPHILEKPSFKWLEEKLKEL